MNVASNPLFRIGPVQADLALGLAGITLDTAERLLQAQFGASRDAIDDSMRHAAALAAARSLDEWLALHAGAALPRLDRVFAFARLSAEAAAQARVRLDTLVASGMASLIGGSDAAAAVTPPAAATARTAPAESAPIPRRAARRASPARRRSAKASVRAKGRSRGR